MAWAAAIVLVLVCAKEKLCSGQETSCGNVCDSTQDGNPAAQRENMILEQLQVLTEVTRALQEDIKAMQGDIRNLKQGSSILILRNDVDGSNSRFFNRPWAEYRQEFGSPTSRYWIGLDRLHEVSQWNCKIRFDLTILNGSSYLAQYSNFSVGGPSTNYTLTIGGYSGDEQFDAMYAQNGEPFSTYDFDNDKWNRPGISYTATNCARVYGGGFWYGDCAFVWITTSPASTYFLWGIYRLSSVEVRLWC